MDAFDPSARYEDATWPGRGRLAISVAGGGLALFVAAGFGVALWRFFQDPIGGFVGLEGWLADYFAKACSGHAATCAAAGGGGLFAVVWKYLAPLLMTIFPAALRGSVAGPFADRISALTGKSRSQTAAELAAKTEATLETVKRKREAASKKPLTPEGEALAAERAAAAVGRDAVARAIEGQAGITPEQRTSEANANARNYREAIERAERKHAAEHGETEEARELEEEFGAEDVHVEDVHVEAAHVHH